MSIKAASDGSLNRYSQSSDSDFSISNDITNESSTESSALEKPRTSGRFFRRSVSYLDYEEFDEEEEEEEIDQKLSSYIVKSDKIEQIFLSRDTSEGMEYLVTFQGADSPFAQWIPSSILQEFRNFSHQLEKFTTSGLKFSYYDARTFVFSSSFDSPLHILAHRRLEDGRNEYLLQFNLEIGSPMFWEAQSESTPQNLVDSYMKSRTVVSNSHPPFPNNISIPSDYSIFKSTDGSIPRDYQIEGANFMLNCLSQSHGCILADEMGLGKTVQALLYLSFLAKTTEFHGPSLIIVRTNTFKQWCSETERWSDLKYIPYCGDPETRELIRKYRFPAHGDDGKPIQGSYSFQVAIATYEIVLKDAEQLSTIEWQIIIADEGHRIKNASGKKHLAISSLPYSQRVILTGTPIQNTLQELYALLHFVSPSSFKDPSLFPEDDVESLEIEELNSIKLLVKPHILRRTLQKVEKSILPKNEKLVLLSMTKIQAELTRLTLLHEIARIEERSHGEPQSEANIQQRICNHPFLVNGVERFYATNKISRKSILVSSSAKLIFLDRILPILKNSGRKVLIFCQRLKVISILAEYCRSKKYMYSKLIGTMTEDEKQKAIEEFSNGEAFVFLISTRSGSEGLNLTKATVAIIYDPDWNPQNDIQAQSRCHRIGQTQKVDVLRLICYGTYEMEVFARAQRKLGLWLNLLGEVGKVGDCNVVSPPPIEKEVKSDDFDEAVTLSASIIQEGDISSFCSLPFQRVDFSDGRSDEEFLSAFGVSDLKKRKERATRVIIEPRVAKEIITELRNKGYGKCEGFGIPNEQLAKFCQTIAILHFRALTANDAVGFPLMIERLMKEASIEADVLLCANRNDMFKIFRKRSQLSGEVGPCKLIRGSICRNSKEFLRDLEAHEAGARWAELGVEFDYTTLQPKFNNDDKEVVEALARGRLAKDIIRMEEVMKIMRRSVICSIHFEFWCTSEVLEINRVIKNFGASLQANEAYRRSAIITKNLAEFEKFYRYYLQMIISRKIGSQMILPEQLTNLRSAPIGTEKVIFSAADGNSLYTRIALFSFIDAAITKLRTGAVKWDGEGCMNQEKLVSLLEFMKKNGIESMSVWLLGECSEEITKEDADLLRNGGFNQNQTSSRLPQFLTTDWRFCQFLTKLQAPIRKEPKAEKTKPKKAAQKEEPKISFRIPQTTKIVFEVLPEKKKAPKRVPRDQRPKVSYKNMC